MSTVVASGGGCGRRREREPLVDDELGVSTQCASWKITASANPTHHEHARYSAPDHQAWTSSDRQRPADVRELAATRATSRRRTASAAAASRSAWWPGREVGDEQPLHGEQTRTAPTVHVLAAGGTSATPARGEASDPGSCSMSPRGPSRWCTVGAGRVLPRHSSEPRTEQVTDERQDLVWTRRDVLNDGWLASCMIPGDGDAAGRRDRRADPPAAGHSGRTGRRSRRRSDGDRHRLAWRRRRACAISADVEDGPQHRRRAPLGRHLGCGPLEGLVQ